VDNRNDLREFLRSRRAKITPEQAGLPNNGRRRVPGLRREEVAMLAGVSVDYYNRLERGAVSGASDSVLSAICRALHLDDAEAAHLVSLSRVTVPLQPTRRGAQPRVRSSIQHLLDSMTGAPAIVQNGRLDILAANALGRALYSGTLAPTGHPANHARFIFLDPAATGFYGSWDRAVSDTVAMLRAEAGRNPFDPELSKLVGELATRSDTFRTQWAAHNVRQHLTGTKTFIHPVVGTLTLAYDALDVAGSPGLTMIAYTAEPGSASAEALNLLASWSATNSDEPARS